MTLIARFSLLGRGVTLRRAALGLRTAARSFSSTADSTKAGVGPFEHRLSEIASSESAGRSFPKAAAANSFRSFSYPMLPIQERAAMWMPLADWICGLSARALGSKRLTPRDNTRRCYEDFFDPLCSDTGVWSDYTEGYYEDGTETYEEANTKQYDFILDRVRADRDTLLIEMGCGYGRLLDRAVERGCPEPQGITLSRTQARACREKGLDVEVMNFFDCQEHHVAGSFDVVIMNGPTEHFVTEEDVLSGKKDAIHDRIFEVASHLLKPGGRLFITCIHLRHPTDIREVLKPALQHEVGSYYFHCSILVSLYSGWYPDIGDYERAGRKNGLIKKSERDATKDYYTTSRLWGRKLRSFLRAPENRQFRNKFFIDLFFKDPNYFFTACLFMFYDSWTWQFRPDKNGVSPMMHRWLMFEKEE